MSGTWLARFSGADIAPVDLRTGPQLGTMSAPVRRQVQRQVEQEQGRMLVLGARSRALSMVTQMALTEVHAARQMVEMYAMTCPEERMELDIMARAHAMGQARIIGDCSW